MMTAALASRALFCLSLSMMTKLMTEKLKHMSENTNGMIDHKRKRVNPVPSTLQRGGGSLCGHVRMNKPACRG